MKSKITVHCIVKNEERWIWFAIQSVLGIAGRVIVYDTGSTDNTVEIIKSIKSRKIDFSEKGSVNPKELVNLRREQLKETKTEWFMILDGDEIWPNNSKNELLKTLALAKPKDWGVVIRAWNFVGDVFHYHSESTKYNWPFAPKNWQGWANLRLLRTSIAGLHIEGTYPLEAYMDNTNTPVQNYGNKHLLFLKNRYFHTTYLQRSNSRTKDKKTLNRNKKTKMELGIAFANSFKFPEVFYKNRPDIVASPFIRRSTKDTLLSALQTPAKELRRKVLKLYNPK